MCMVPVPLLNILWLSETLFLLNAIIYFVKVIYMQTKHLNLFRMGFFGAAYGWEGAKSPPPNLKSVTHILQWWNLAQLYVTYRRLKKHMNYVTHALTSGDKFCYIKKYRYRLHFGTQFLILLTFFDSLKIAVIKMFTILITSPKLATPGLLEIKLF